LVATLPTIPVLRALSDDRRLGAIVDAIAGGAGAVVLPFQRIPPRRLALSMLAAFGNVKLLREKKRPIQLYPLTIGLANAFRDIEIPTLEAQQFRRASRVNAAYNVVGGQLVAAIKGGVNPSHAEQRLEKLGARGDPDAQLSKVLGCKTIGLDGADRPFDNGAGDDLLLIRSMENIALDWSASVFLDASSSWREREFQFNELTRLSSEARYHWNFVASGPLSPGLHLLKRVAVRCVASAPEDRPRWTRGVSLEARLDRAFVDDIRHRLLAVGRGLREHHDKAASSPLGTFHHVLRLLQCAHFGIEGLRMGAESSSWAIDPRELHNILSEAAARLTALQPQMSSEFQLVAHDLAQAVAVIGKPSDAAGVLTRRLADAAIGDGAEPILIVCRSYQQAVPIVDAIARHLGVAIAEIVGSLVIPVGANGLRRAILGDASINWREIHVVDEMDPLTLHCLSLVGAVPVHFHADDASAERMLVYVERCAEMAEMSAFKADLDQLRHAFRKTTSATSEFASLFELYRSRADDEEAAGAFLQSRGVAGGREIRLVFDDDSELFCRRNRSIDIVDDQFTGATRAKYAHQLQRGDLVVLVHGTTGAALERRLLDALSASAVWGAHADVVRTWRAAIETSYANSRLSIESLLQRLRAESCVRSEDTVRGWLEGAVLAPKEHDDLRRISRVLGVWQDRPTRIESTIDAVSNLRSVRLKLSCAWTRILVSVAAGRIPNRDDTELLNEAGIDELDLIDAASLRTVAAVSAWKGP
jgi:hypothetical protein